MPPASPVPDTPVSVGSRLDPDTVVARAQDGDLDAFEQLVDLFQVKLFRLAYRMLNDRGEAEDTVQETMIIAWRRLPSLATPAAFNGWIYQIATRQCLSILRTRVRRNTDVADADTFVERSSPDDGPDRTAEKSAALHRLNAVLATLPDEQRACWVLKELHDLSYQEIANILQIPVSTVRGRIARARPLLAEGMSSWR